MLKAIHLVGLTGLKGAQMETLLEEAGVTVTKSGTILSQVRKTCGSADQKTILTADETVKLRAYCKTQATGLAVQADFVWSQMEDFFKATGVPGVETLPHEAETFSEGELDGNDLNDDGDLDGDVDESIDGTDDLDDDGDLDNDELGDDLDDDLDNDLDDLDGDLEGDEDDNLGGGDVEGIFDGGSSTPVDYDRSSLEVDGENLEFPDSEKDQPAAQDNSVASLFG